MWFLPLLVIGAIVIAATSRSPRVLPPPPRLPLLPAGPPGPISVLGEYARVGQVPPDAVILCAIAEAEFLGRSDVASEIIRVLVAPVVNEHTRAIEHARPTGDPFIDRVFQGIPMIPMHGVRGTLPPPLRRSSGDQGPPNPQMAASRPQAPYERGSFKPAVQQYERGPCALPASPRALAARRAPVWTVPPARASLPVPVVRVIPHMDLPSTDEELRAMINADPRKFIALATGVVPAPSPSSHPVVVVDVDAHGVPSPVHAALPPDEELRAMINLDPERFIALATDAAAAVGLPVRVVAVDPHDEPTMQADELAEQLQQMPGFSAAGVTLVGPSLSEEIFEVRWLRGYAIPSLPQTISGRPVRVVIVDEHAVAQAQATPETVVQMQEEPPGSPLANVSDNAWRAFVACLERESPSFDSSRHVGQYRQRRERLAELGIDANALLGSASSQRAALDADLVDAYRHAAEGGLFAMHVGRPVVVPGMDEAVRITCSGVLGVIQCAGLDGATGWLQRSGDRKRYPHTSQAFTRTNGRF